MRYCIINEILHPKNFGASCLGLKCFSDLKYRGYGIFMVIPRGYFFCLSKYLFLGKGERVKVGDTKMGPGNKFMLYIIGSVFWCRFQIWINFSKVYNFWPRWEGCQNGVMGMVIRHDHGHDHLANTNMN